jgi:hypothetical protein
MTRIAHLALAAALLLSPGLASAKPRHAKVADPEVSAASAALKIARAKAKVTKAAKSAHSAAARADAAIERCEQSIVDLCLLQHDGREANSACEDVTLAPRFAVCHATSAPAQRAKPVQATKQVAYQACLSEVETDDADVAAERCAGELE